jgi:AcrR family transcriptional regulator
MLSQDERLIEAMTELVSEIGYRRASVAKVIERAGVSRKTFYEIYEDRAACFAAARGRASKAIEAALKGEDGVAALIDLYGRQPEYFDLVFGAAVATGAEETRVHLKARDRWAKWLEKEASERKQAKRSRKGPARQPSELARMAFAGLITAICRSAEAGEDPLSSAEEAAQLAFLPWSGPQQSGDALG